MDEQEVVNEYVEQVNREDGYTPAIVELVMMTEKILLQSEQILRDTEKLLKQVEEIK